ncbi:MAG TPA: M48 family metalloprotease, partial [Acidobacteriota bacterium]
MEKKNLKAHGAGRAGGIGRTLRQSVALLVAFSFALAPVAWADRTALKPGWNLFSAQQDVEVGQQVSRDAERQLPMLNDARVDNYVNNLGRRLAAFAPGEKYPYQFKVVNDRTINAFALPGGPVYINRGVIEAADDEAQLAGVIAHETSHVALRHGTNQASKAYVAQVPLALLGGMLGSNSAGAVLAQLGAGFAINSLLLKYSRTAESQADMMGTQILFDSNYDPRAMGQFFEKIQADQTGRTVEFFSNHPSPDNRMESVSQEVDRLGGPQRGFTSDSREFQDIKRYVLSLPAPPARGTQQAWHEDRDRNDRHRSGTLELRILSASYGANDRFIDVRERMQSRVQDNRLDLQVNNSSMGGDPIGQSKTLQMRYRWGNRDYDVTIRENQRLSIPTEQQISDANGGYHSRGLRIVSAVYGANNQLNDVRQLLQSRVQNDRLNQLVNNSSMGGDPSRGYAKTLRIRYEWDNKSYSAVARENQRILIPTDQQVSDTNEGNNSIALRIVTASYGSNSRSNDVRELLQSRVQNDRLNQLVNSSTMGGDPSRGYAKSL